MNSTFKFVICSASQAIRKIHQNGTVILLNRSSQSVEPSICIQQSKIHVSSVDLRNVTGKYFPTRDRSKPLTYEMANSPHQIAHRKGWNSWNTSNVLVGKRKSETQVDDMFIRKFLAGTWHNLFVSEIIIKRQYNMIRVAGLVQRTILPRKMYFLIGYTEEILSYWLKCPVKLELQTVADKKETIYKYI